MLLAAFQREAVSSGACVPGCNIYTPNLIHKGHCLARFLGTPVFWEALGFQLVQSLCAVSYWCHFLGVRF